MWDRNKWLLTIHLYFQSERLLQGLNTPNMTQKEKKKNIVIEPSAKLEGSLKKEKSEVALKMSAILDWDLAPLWHEKGPELSKTLFKMDSAIKTRRVYWQSSNMLLV